MHALKRKMRLSSSNLGQEDTVIVLTICSTKGGVGKTTLTANLAGFLADAGQQVLLVDADIQPTLSQLLSRWHSRQTPACIS